MKTNRISASYHLTLLHLLCSHFWSGPLNKGRYGIPRSDEGGGYDIDALNAFSPDLFEKLLIDHTDACFDGGIHEKVLQKFPELDFIKIVSVIGLMHDGGRC